MDDAFAFIVFLAVMACAAIGIGYLVTDNRYFGTIQYQCEKMGYIQNDKVRIYCNVEKSEK